MLATQELGRAGVCWGETGQRHGRSQEKQEPGGVSSRVMTSIVF